MSYHCAWCGALLVDSDSTYREKPDGDIWCDRQCHDEQIDEMRLEYGDDEPPFYP